MPRLQDQDHWIFLVWLTITGLSVFGAIVCWHEGLIDLLVASDRSHISLVIGMLYVIGSAHCARRARVLSLEGDAVRALARHIGDRVVDVRSNGGAAVDVDGHAVDVHSIMGEHLAALVRRGHGDANQDNEQSTLVDTLVAETKGSHDLGWFMVDVLLKLGLLGTIVGFILMLGSVADTASLDVNTMQKVLKQMSNGMGTALYTTLAGLAGSMALGLQYLLLEKGADDLIERILRLSDSRVRIGAA
ncbi:MAG: MotA/TolQ/ExbB proton channel family protein [Gammaproteobacteria bacterium]